MEILFFRVCDEKIIIKTACVTSIAAGSAVCGAGKKHRQKRGYLTRSPSNLERLPVTPRRTCFRGELSRNVKYHEKQAHIVPKPFLQFCVPLSIDSGFCGFLPYVRVFFFFVFRSCGTRSLTWKPFPLPATTTWVRTRTFSCRSVARREQRKNEINA